MSKKILIVDDEPDVLAALNMRLVSAGYVVVQAANGSEAIRLAKKEVPDLVLLDIMMPSIDGPHVAQALKDDPLTANIPVVFLTCLITPSEQGQGLNNVGGHFFIAKPYDPASLLAEISRHIS